MGYFSKDKPQEKKKLLNIRMRKMHIAKPTTTGKDYYKSHIQQYNHDIQEFKNGKYSRIEKMDSGYLKNPGAINIQFVKIKLEDIENKWAEKFEDHMENRPGKKSLKEANWKKTKPVLNFLISFNADFELKTQQEQIAHGKSVMKFINKKFGGNLIYMTQKNDEDGLKYSFSVLNYDDEEHKSLARSKTVDWFSNLQDEIADQLKSDNQDYGFTRGLKGSKAKHITLGESRKKVAKLEQKIVEKQEQLDAITEVLNLSQIREIWRDIRKQIKDGESSKIDKIEERFNRANTRGDKESMLKNVSAGSRVLKAVEKKKKNKKNNIQQ